MNLAAKVILGVATVGLGLYGVNNIEIDNTIKFDVGSGEIAIHIKKDKDYFKKIRSSLRRDKFDESESLEDIVQYAKKLPISKNAMPLDKMVNILNEQYKALWPERPIDEKYFIAIMNIESKYDPKAYNPNGGATGLSGFLRSSWHKNSKKPFKYATDPEEHIKALVTLTKKNLEYLHEYHPNWHNLTEVEQYIQIGLAHSAGAARMRRAKFDAHKVKPGWVRTQSIDYQAKMKDYLNR